MKSYEMLPTEENLINFSSKTQLNEIKILQIFTRYYNVRNSRVQLRLMVGGEVEKHFLFVKLK